MQNEPPPNVLANPDLSKVNISKALRNVVLNAAVADLDKRVQECSNDPSIQMAVLMLTHVLAFRRVIEQAGPMNRGRRHKVMSMAVRDFESRLKEYGVDSVKD